jgi:hypothetical protein
VKPFDPSVTVWWGAVGREWQGRKVKVTIPSPEALSSNSPQEALEALG